MRNKKDSDDWEEIVSMRVDGDCDLHMIEKSESGDDDDGINNVTSMTGTQAKPLVDLKGEEEKPQVDSDGDKETKPFVQIDGEDAKEKIDGGSLLKRRARFIMGSIGHAAKSAGRSIGNGAATEARKVKEFYEKQGVEEKAKKVASQAKDITISTGERIHRASINSARHVKTFYEEKQVEEKAKNVASKAKAATVVTVEKVKKLDERLDITGKVASIAGCAAAFQIAQGNGRAAVGSLAVAATAVGAGEAMRASNNHRRPDDGIFID